MTNYHDYSKDELLAIIQKQAEELKNKKYGLVWDSEREPEQVVLDCENNLPILTRVKGREIRTTDGEDNILIEGDNYHALTVLSYTHKEKIDVIYIDPPYNTGNKSWKYNNNYVEPDDGYWHSKWLNMMEKRLNIAKRVLKSDGCLICAIDENEFANLNLLLLKIFPSYRIDQIVIVHNPRGVQGKNFSYTHEYALFVYPNDGKEYVGNRKIDNAEIGWSNLRNWGGESLRTDAKNCFYPVIVQNGAVVGFGDVLGIKSHPKAQTEKRGEKFYVYPIDIQGVERKWRYARQSVEEIKHLLKAKKTKSGFEIEIGKDFGAYRTVWIDKRYDANENGSKLVKQITGQDFPYPKSLFTVKDCLSAIIAGKKDAISLDFFAGSGTTGHAILDLNKEDGGNRKFILCTNNELNGIEKELREKGLSEKEIQANGICQKTTYPRLEKVIKGYKKNGNGENVQGLGGNLQYFRTGFVRKTKNRDQVRLSLTGKCTGMLCVKENIFNIEAENDNYKIFSSNNKDKFLCVYYNFEEDGIEEFIGKIIKIKGRKIIYMFSVDNEVDKSIFSAVKDFTVEAIPEGILKEYEKLNKMNIPINKDLIYFDFNKAQKVIFEQGDKDGGAILLRIVLEKIIPKIAQINGVGVLKLDGKREKTALLNDKLKSSGIFSKVEWEENKTYLAIGNHAAHGEYTEYDLNQVKSFYQHIQMLLNKFNI